MLVAVKGSTILIKLKPEQAVPIFSPQNNYLGIFQYVTELAHFLLQYGQRFRKMFNNFLQLKITNSLIWS